jgi:hypothetical protein
MTNFKYGNQFFDTQEDVNAYILEKEFNKQLKWFNDFNRHPRFDHIDYDAKDKKGRKVHIELKQRKGTIDDFKRFGDVIIEPTKLEAFAKVMESGYTLDEQRLYINWTDDGAIIYTFQGEVIPVVYYLNHKQKNYGKNNQEEHEDRMGIPIDYAAIYKKDENGRYKLIQKPTKTMKSELKKKWWELIINLF